MTHPRAPLYFKVLGEDQRRDRDPVMNTGPIAGASHAFMQAAESLPTLYSLAAEWVDLVDLLTQPEPDQAAIDAELDHVAHDIRAKAYGIAIVIQGMEIKADNLKAEEARLAAKRKACEAAADRLRAYTLTQMQTLGQERIDTGTFLLTVRQNPQAVTVLDAAAVPSEYTRTKIIVDVDKRAILEAFRRDGEVVPGTEITRGERLRIS